MSDHCREVDMPGASTPCVGAIILGLCEAHAAEYTDWLLQRSLQRHAALRQIADSVPPKAPRKKPTAARKIALAKYAEKRRAK